MKRKITYFSFLLTALFIVGCDKKADKPINSIDKPENITQLLDLLNNTTAQLEANETKSATRETIETSRQLFSIKTTVTKENLSTYEGPYAISKGVKDVTHEKLEDFESDIFDPIHDEYTGFTGVYENNFYQIVDYENGKDNDVAKEYTYGEGLDISEKEAKLYSTMDATDYIKTYLNDYFIPVLSPAYSLTASTTKNSFSYYLSASDESSNDFAFNTHEFSLSLTFGLDGFLQSYLLDYSITSQNYDTDGQLLEAYLSSSLSDKVTITRGKRAIAENLEIIPTNYWLKDYDVQLQVRDLYENLHDYDADKLPVSQYLAAEAINVSPEKAIDTKLTIIASSNEDVIEMVADGLAKTISAGTTTLTIKSASGITKQIEATVVAEVAQKIEFKMYSSSYIVGQSYSFFLMITPENAVDEYEITVSNDNVSFEIGEDGKSGTITCLKPGSVTLTATSKGNPSISGSKTIEITAPLSLEELQTAILGTWKDIEIDGSTLTLNENKTGEFVWVNTTTSQSETFTFTWEYDTFHYTGEYMIKLSSFDSWDSNTCYFTPDGQQMRIDLACSNPDEWFYQYQSDFIKQ